MDEPDSRGVKRNAADSPEGGSERDKFLRDQSPVQQDISVMKVTDLISAITSPPTTPVSSKNNTLSPRTLDLLEKCKNLEVSQKEKLNCGYLYSLILGLEMTLQAGRSHGAA